MRWKPASLDEEIQAVERCIASDRELLEQAVVGYVEGVRESAVRTVASPKFLIGAVGIGFVIGKILFRPQSQPQKQEQGAPAKKSVLGLLGAGALSLVQAQFGGPLGLARWLTAKAYEYRRAAQPSSAPWETPIEPSSPYAAPRQATASAPPASSPSTHYQQYQQYR